MYAIGIYKPGGIKTDINTNGQMMNNQNVAESITQVTTPTNNQTLPPINNQNIGNVIPNIVGNNNVQIIGGNNQNNHSSNIIYSTNNYSNSTSAPIIGKGPGE